MTRAKARSLKNVIVALLAAIVLIAVVWRANNIKTSMTEEAEEVTVTAIDEALARNLTTNYPQTPKEVIKYFGEISKCFYNETFEDDDELIKLADQMLLLYDDELVAYNNHDNYIFDLKTQINYYKENNIILSHYDPQASTDVEYFTEDGYEWSRIRCDFTLKSGKVYKVLTEIFILRKDENGHWRIYGWEEADDE